MKSYLGIRLDWSGDNDVYRERRLRVLIDVLQLHFAYVEGDPLDGVTVAEDSKGTLILRINRSVACDVHLLSEAATKVWELLDCGGVVELEWQLTEVENDMPPEHRFMRQRMR